MDTSQLAKVHIGATVAYRLRFSQLPTNPARLWYGRVEDVHKSSSNEGVGMCWVRSIEPGYEGTEECILFDQIVEVIKPKG